MPKQPITSLQDLTGHESGAVLYPESDEIWIGNWSSIEGLPREFATGTIGLGEQLHAKRCAVPASVKSAMQNHEREQKTDVSKTGFAAWSINKGTAIAVIQYDWI